VAVAVERVGVLGGGLMGGGIAESVAAAGLSVVVREIDDDALTAARDRLSGSLERAERKERISIAERDQIETRIEFATDLGALADVDLVIEAVPERLDLKHAVLAELAAALPTECLIASNTSSISISRLAAPLPNPGRVLGLHFFSPVPLMPLVELVRALQTDSKSIASASEFVERIGKTPIESKDRGGFIVNALLIPYLVAAIRLHEEGFASPAEIDEGMKLGAGHPMGPLELCDQIGLDVLCSACESLYAEFRQTAYAPPPLLRQMVDAGWLGRKSGRGFHET